MVTLYIDNPRKPRENYFRPRQSEVNNGSISMLRAFLCVWDYNGDMHVWVFIFTNLNESRDV